MTELIAAVTPKTKAIPMARSIIPELNMLIPPQPGRCPAMSLIGLMVIPGQWQARTMLRRTFTDTKDLRVGAPRPGPRRACYTSRRWEHFALSSRAGDNSPPASASGTSLATWPSRTFRLRWVKMSGARLSHKRAGSSTGSCCWRKCSDWMSTTEFPDLCALCCRPCQLRCISAGAGAVRQHDESADMLSGLVSGGADRSRVSAGWRR
jgi:hypothetical protein